MKQNILTKFVALLGAAVLLLTPGCATFQNPDRVPPTPEQIATVFTPLAAWGVSKLATQNPELLPFLPIISGVVRHFHDSGEIDPVVLAIQIRAALRSNGIELLDGEDASTVILVSETVISFYRLYAGDLSIRLENRPIWLRSILLIIAEGIDAQPSTQI
jgi:hypothetical protein